MYSLNIYKIYVNYFFATDPDNRKEKSLHFEFKFLPKTDAFDDIIWKKITFLFLCLQALLKKFHPPRPDWYEEFYASVMNSAAKDYEAEVFCSFLIFMGFVSSFFLIFFRWCFVFVVIALCSSLGCFLVRLQCTSLKSSVT